MHESPRDLPVEAPLPPELRPYLVLETESAEAPSGSCFQGWWVLAWQSKLPVLQIEKGRSHPVGRCMTLQGDGQRQPILDALQGAGLFITTERHWLADAAHLGIPTIWVADGRPDCSALTGRDELAPGTGLPPESALFEPGLFQAVFSHTAYRRELPLRRLFEAVQRMAPGILHEDLSESSACRTRMLPHLRGRLADIGHGGCKILPQALGVDFFQYDESDWIGDARDLWFFQDQHFDTVYSSHCLEDLWHPHQALEEWTRILRIGGRLCLYLPLKDHYPNVGTPGCNPGHKDDYVPEDVEAFLRDLGHMDLLVSQRRESEDSFEVIAEKKAGRSYFVQREQAPQPLVSVLIPGPTSLEPREDARTLVACIETAHASLEGIAHEILVLDRSSADSDGRAGLRDLAARHAEIHIVEDRSPATWPRRLTRLQRMAQGTWTCILDGSSFVQGSALRTLVEQAELQGATVAWPAVLDTSGRPQDEQTPVCLLLRADAHLLAETERTPFLTRLYLRSRIHEVEATGRLALRVDQAQILHEGWGSQTLSTIKLSPHSFDQDLLARPNRSAFEGERILVTMLRTLGDCVLATPILEALEARDPACQITVLTEEPYGWIFENHPHVSDLVLVNDVDDEDFALHEDAILDHYLQSPESPAFDRLIFLSDRLDQATYHQSGSSLQEFYAELAGVPEAAELRPRVFLSESTRQEAQRVLDSHGIGGAYAILHRKAGWSNKDISPELADQIARKIRSETHLEILQIGGPGEGIESPSVIDLCGQLAARVSAALIEGASLHVGPDSGPLHLASTFDVQSVGVYAGSGIRVAPPLSWKSVAVQSPSSCALACGVSTCTQRRPCAEDLDLGLIGTPLRALVSGDSDRSEFIGNDEALYLRGPAGDQWIQLDALPIEGGTNAFSRRNVCVDGPPVNGRATPLRPRICPLPAAAERRNSWIQQVQALIAPSTVEASATSQSSFEAARQVTLDSLPSWSAIEAERSIATAARRKGDLQGRMHWLMQALARSERTALGEAGRKRPAFRLLAEELHFDLCHALKTIEDRVPHLLYLLERFQKTFDQQPPLVPALAVLTAEGGLAARDSERHPLQGHLQEAVEGAAAMPDPQLLLLTMALSRIGEEQEAIQLLESRLNSIPADRHAQRAAFSVRLGFLLATDPEAIESARNYLCEAIEGLQDDGQREQVLILLARIDQHLGISTVTPDPGLLQPQPTIQEPRSYNSGPLRVREYASIESLATDLGFRTQGRILEPDIDIPENECELEDRKRRDAEVLCWLAANVEGNVLDLGTSHGRSAFKLATNTRPGETVYTINALPEQIQDHERHITHRIEESEIGSYYRDRGITNVEQILANTMDWTPPPQIRDLGLVFVDANHDGAAVYSDSQKTWNLLREGGYLIWHDFSPDKRERFPWIDSVMQGIEAFVYAQQIDSEILHLEGSWIGVLRKTTAIASPKSHLEHI